jgi:hypothetical protein
MEREWKRMMEGWWRGTEEDEWKWKDTGGTKEGGWKEDKGKWKDDRGRMEGGWRQDGRRMVVKWREYGGRIDGEWRRMRGGRREKEWGWREVGWRRQGGCEENS